MESILKATLAKIGEVEVITYAPPVKRIEEKEPVVEEQPVA